MIKKTICTILFLLGICSAFAQDTYKMRTGNSCGPDAVFFVLHGMKESITQKAVDDAWGITDIKKFANVWDTPFNHFAVLNKLGFRYRKLSSDDLLNNRGARKQTLLLVHNSKDPEVRNIFSEIAGFLRENLEEDWIVFKELGVINGEKYVRVFVGDGTVKQLTQKRFEKLINSGVVRCIYSVEFEPGHKFFLAQFWHWITKKVFRRK